VLVLQNGRPLTISWAAQHVPAILEAWYPGEFGGKAMAMTLFGDNNPSGHLTITFPRTIGMLPDYYNFDPSKNHRYVDGDDTPVFPFGFGLSYTTFRFEGLHVDAPGLGKGPVHAAVNVTNTGSVAGDEVVQLYIRQDVSSVETPERALKGFSRVSLQPGETKTVNFEVAQDDLALWSAEKKWVVEAGTYAVWVGDSSQAPLTAKFTLQRASARAR
jgi:beta-glucosidase